ncbi:TMEM175 family protein [Dellaglioa sp. BT-FLS60]
MNKARVEAFTDAVIAILLTIMVLEFTVPETAKLNELIKIIPYFFSYATSFLFMGVGWFSHHFMFSLTKRVTKKIYWLNNFWIFSMSFIPVATAWTGRFMADRVPEYTYFAVCCFWSLTFILLTREIKVVNEEKHPEVSRKIDRMIVYGILTSWYYPVLIVAVLVGIYFFPPTAVIAQLVMLSIMAINTRKDGDRIFDEK